MENIKQAEEILKKHCDIQNTQDGTNWFVIAALKESILLAITEALSLSEQETEDLKHEAGVYSEPLKGKLDFYRGECSKLRKYAEEKKIGKPSQKLFEALYDHIQSLEQSNKVLLEALKDIANPVARLLEACKKDGVHVDGMMAVSLDGNASYLKELARTAIQKHSEINK